jgi:membrane-bound metal-dependent hydrolase YbcI (DUF457 family)
MPFTPFHLGPALFFGLVLFMIFDLPTFLIASVIPDIEPFYVMYFHVSGYPLHGFFHSYLGSSILALLVAFVVYPLRGLLSRVMVAFRIPQNSSFKKILLASFIGVYFHVFLDSFLYPEMMPLYPLQGNPFIGALSAYGSYSVIYGFCSITALFGIALYFYKVSRRRNNSGLANSLGQKQRKSLELSSEK